MRRQRHGRLRAELKWNAFLAKGAGRTLRFEKKDTMDVRSEGGVYPMPSDGFVGDAFLSLTMSENRKGG